MDPIQVEKLRAMARYKNHSHSFLDKLGMCSLTTVVIVLFFSTPFWISPLSIYTKSFLFISLPTTLNFFFSPKLLFVISNIIVFILVGESTKFLANPKSKPMIDVYSEYVKNNKACEKLHLSERKVHFYKEEAQPENSPVKDGAREDEEMGDRELKEGEDDENKWQTRNVVDNLDDADECCLPVDELNKRVEDFIAKINQQRILETEFL